MKKALSITEPYATIIKLGHKMYETRSWKTNYRGTIYIHASSTRIPKAWRENKELMSLANNTTNQGKIVAMATLTDCILMTPEFIEIVKENKDEYISGFYEVGRYAWKLENIVPIDSDKIVKGNRCIWNLMEDI